jgi:hypothetical protein
MSESPKINMKKSEVDLNGKVNEMMSTAEKKPKMSQSIM